MVIDPCRRLVSEVRSDGTMPKKPDGDLGLGKRWKSPTSAHSPAADSVSIPRDAPQPVDHRGVRAVGDLLLERAQQREAAGA